MNSTGSVPPTRWMELDILTMNLWGLPWPVSRDRHDRKRRFVDHLQRNEYDIVGLQELWWPWRDAVPSELFRLPRGRRDSGLALGGRLRDRASVEVEYYDARGGIDRLKNKGLLKAPMEITDGTDENKGIEIVVCVTHLQFGRGRAATRTHQVDQLLRSLEHERRPTVLMGDFNFHGGNIDDESSARRMIDAGFADAAVLVHGSDRALRPTYTSDNSYVRRRNHHERFDRVYLRDAAAGDIRIQALGVEEADVLTAPVSDHHPVHARVRVES